MGELKSLQLKTKKIVAKNCECIDLFEQNDFFRREIKNIEILEHAIDLPALVMPNFLC